MVAAKLIAVSAPPHPEEPRNARRPRRLRQRPAFLAVSAKTGRGIERLLDAIEELFDRHNVKIPTPEFNRALDELKEKRQPPSRNGKRLNMLYGAQIHQRPPRFRIFVNDPAIVTRDYGYWVENELRDRFGLEGVPVVHREPGRGAGAEVERRTRAAERLRSAVEGAVIQHGTQHIPVTLSIGCASVATCKEPSPEVLLEAADRRLYAAKRGGRNRVVGQ